MPKIINYILLSLHCCLAYSHTISTGLQFHSHQFSGENRTSLILNPEMPFRFTSGFELSFDVKLRYEKHNYGYVFRIIGNDSVCFDLISNFGDERRSLMLVCGNVTFTSFDESDLSFYNFEEWVPVVMKLDPDKEEISLSFQGKTIIASYHCSDLNSFQFYFGYCDALNFKSTEVPPMSIKNISIRNEKKRLVAFWELKKHGLNVSYDLIRYLPAKAYNPVWEIDQYISWKKEKEFSAPIHTQIAVNDSNGCIYFTNQDFTLKYTSDTNVLDTIRASKGNPYKERANQLIYNPYYKELWSYDFDKQHVARYLMDQNIWTNRDTELKNPLYSQHNAFISPVDSCLYTFGGYGEYQYKNVLQKKDKTGPWITVHYNDSVSPRFLAASGFKTRDSLLLFGGYGHPSGKQELGPYHYYDLHVLDLKNLTFTKLWDLHNVSPDFFVANSLVVDSNFNRFLALCIGNDDSKAYMTLKSFDLSTGKHSTLADLVPFHFDNINSFLTLYYNKGTNRLFAVNLLNQKDQSEIKIYSLAYPPIDPKLVYQAAPDNHSILSRHFLLLSVLAVLLLVVSCLFFFAKIKKRKQKQGSDTIITDIKDVNLETIPVIEKISSSVNFIGGFQVLDKQGEDITGLFTPTMKQVLILIILYTVKNEKGLSNATFNNILWEDKSEESAQNNRRVNIRKLRMVFNQLDGIEITKGNGYWTIKHDERFYCDYIYLMELIKKIHSEQKIKLDDLHELIKLTGKGKLLPYIQQEWLDAFKADYSNMILDTFMEVSKKEELKNDFKLQIQIADSMFMLDSVDEYALILKCRALYASGKTGLAKGAYDTFCSEYFNLLGNPYKKDFSDIVS